MKISEEQGFEIIETGDGSITYKKGGLSYRSTHGAKSESLHVFVQAPKLLNENLPQWHILELGFGSAMNLSTTYALARANNIKLVYYSLEPNLMPIHMLLIPDFIKNNIVGGLYTDTHLELRILPTKWESWTSTMRFDAYYHDPFGPTSSPECWTTSCFQWAYAHLKDEGILTTYGASTQARRAMLAANFNVAKGPGSGRKREMTIAAKNPIRIQKQGYEAFKLIEPKS